MAYAKAGRKKSLKLAAFRDLFNWKCEQCLENAALWEQRGKCKGAFVPGARLQPRKDERGFYVTALSLTKDAAAPCFEPEERFYTCPVALAGSDFAVEAFKWYNCYSKPGRSVFMPRKVSALVYSAITEIDAALASRDKYEADKAKKG